MDNILLRDTEILELIPQRKPIVMVDKFGDFSEDGASTALTIKEDNIFLQGGSLQEPGLIEHIAQSAAAFAGYATYQKNLPPKLGYIGEIRRCHISTLPLLGQELNTELKIQAQVAGITLLSATTSVNEQTVVECQMKIFLKDD